MSKALEITPKILELIQKNVANPEFDISKVAVYETVALSTKAISKRGSIFDKGVHSRGTLEEMAKFVNDGGNVPLHTLHQQGTEIPIGRVFFAALNDTSDGHTELRALFFVLKEHSDLIAALETSALDEVSVGINHKHIYCSECNFDYLGESATLMNFYERTCDNGHVLGEGGVHPRLVGMEDWAELSLVSRGAAKDAQIKPKAKRLLGDARYAEMLAAGKNPDLLLLNAKSSLDNKPVLESKLKSEPKDTPEMNVAEFTAELSAKATKLAEVEAKLAASDTAKTAAEARVGELTAELKASTDKVAEVESKLAAAEVPSAETIAYLQDLDKRVRVQTGETNVEVTEKNADKLVASIKSNGDKLKNIPVFGVSQSADDDKNKAPKADFTAFKLTASK